MNREQFLAAGKSRRYDVVRDVPQLGDVRIRSLTEREKSEFEQRQLTRDGAKLSRAERLVRSRAALVACCVVDDAGERLLQDDDVDTLLGMDGLITQRLYDAIVVHVGYAKADIEALAKN